MNFKKTPSSHLRAAVMELDKALVKLNRGGKGIFYIQDIESARKQLKHTERLLWVSLM
jgi:hypothetical protein